MTAKYNIVLVAHDNCKQDLVEWVAFNKLRLKKHHLICTGTTGRLVESEINKDIEESSVNYKKVHCLKSGPLGGDQQVGSLIAEGKVDIVFFFWDPMSQQPHDVDVKALLRITVLYNLPTASNRATADFLISSTLFGDKDYQPRESDFSFYTKRTLV